MDRGCAEKSAEKPAWPVHHCRAGAAGRENRKSPISIGRGPSGGIPGEPGGVYLPELGG